MLPLPRGARKFPPFGHLYQVWMPASPLPSSASHVSIFKVSLPGMSAGGEVAGHHLSLHLPMDALLLGFYFLRFGCLCLSFLFLSSSLIQSSWPQHTHTYTRPALRLIRLCLLDTAGKLALLWREMEENYLDLISLQIFCISSVLR